MTHLPLDELGDVVAAARDPHVLACAQCRQAVAEQRSVRDLLAALPAPSAAPPDVVHAIEATLRRLTPADVVPADAPAAVTVVPMSSAPSRRAVRWRERTPGLLAAAAAVVLAVGLGGLILRGGGGDSGTATSAGASAELRTSAARTAAPPAVLASGTAYTRARLTTQVQALLADRPVADAGATAPRGRLATPAGLRDCVNALGATGAPLAVDLATFDGSPAAIFVLPAAGGGREVWVVSPSCRPGADGTRYFTRLP